MKVLLVDDDRFVIIALQKGIDWKGLGIEEIFTAYNIADAKRIIETEQIDLLLSDIDMPHGNGLELLSYIREKGFSVPAIFMTNYADFSYAQKALELKSFHYYLKPIDYDELTGIIRSALEESDVSASKNRTAFRQLWYNYLLQRQISCDDFFSSARKLDAAMSEDDTYILSLLQLYPYSLGADNKLICSFADISEISEDIHSILDSIYGADFSSLGIFLAYHSENFLMLSLIPLKKGESEMAKDNISLLSEEVIATIKKKYDIHSTMYLSPPCCTRELPGALSDLMALRSGHPDNLDKVLLSKKDGNAEKRTPPRFDTAIAYEALKSNDFERFSQHFYSHIKSCCANGSLTGSTLSDLHIELNQILFSYLGENGILAGELFNNETYHFLGRNVRLSTYYMDLFIRYMTGVAKQYLETESEDENAVSSLLSYVDAHFREEISRNELSEMFFFDPDYITRIFKREKGMSYKNYIIEKRLTLAKKLLSETDYAVRDISLMVGYDNYSYFTRLFKKSYGITPADYRQRPDA